VRDAAGGDAVLTLPAPGAPHSLGANRDIAVGNVQADLTLRALFFTNAPPDGSFALRFDNPADPARRGVYDLTGQYQGAMGRYALTLGLAHDEGGNLTGAGAVTGPMPSGTVVNILVAIKGKTTAGVTALQLAGDKTANALFGAVKLKLTIETFANGTGNILALSGSAFGQALQWPQGNARHGAGTTEPFREGPPARGPRTARAGRPSRHRTP